MTPQEEEKKEELKKLFYTNLSSYAIQCYLCLSQNEYNKLLAIVKKELGLPTNYRRIPSKINDYSDGKYAVFHKPISETDCKVISYAPTKEYAEDLVKYRKQSTIDGEYWFEQATEEHMLDLIETDYYENEQSWNYIMMKLNLSYHTFYNLLNKVKKRKGVSGTRTGRNTRYIYPSHNCWVVRKSVNGVQRDYGLFKDFTTALRVRDYLESINWDYDYWINHKKEVEAITQ